MIAEGEGPAEIEPLDDCPRIGAVEHAGEHRSDGGANEVARHLLGAAQLALVLELELACDRRQRRVQVGDARHNDLFARRQRAPLGIRDHELQRRNREALADARSFVDLSLAARLKRNFLDDLAHVGRNVDLRRSGALGPRLLSRDRHAVGSRCRVVCPDFRADAVFQRRDDLASRVVLWIRGEDEQHVELQADRVPLNLNVAFLQNVEQADLDFPGEVGQLVDGENPAVRPRKQAVMHRQLVGEMQPRVSGLDRIDVAEHVGNRHVGRRELFDVALLARQPHDRHPIAFRRHARAARRAQRREWVVVNLAAWDDGDPFVEQIDESPQNAALRLAAQPEQDEIVLGENGIDELRDYSFVVPDDAREQLLARLEFPNEILADLYTVFWPLLLAMVLSVCAPVLLAVLALTVLWLVPAIRLLIGSTVQLFSATAGGRREDEMAFVGSPAGSIAGGSRSTGPPARGPKDGKSWNEVRRNEQCPCGSGKRYKHCHGSHA